MKNGFTLAEVLITLGIIGVISAITIPSLIQNYQKTVLVNKLKKSYSTLNQGMKTLFYNIDCESILLCLDAITPEEVKKVFKIAAQGTADSRDPLFYYQTTSLGASNYSYDTSIPAIVNGTRTIYIYITMDGMLFTITTSILGMLLYVDVNGAQKPNEFGRDMFTLAILDSGVIVPLGSKAFFDWAHKNDITTEEAPDDDTIRSLVREACVKGTDFDSSAFYCFARIFYDGWKMTY